MKGNSDDLVFRLLKNNRCSILADFFEQNNVLDQIRNLPNDIVILAPIDNAIRLISDVTHISLDKLLTSEEFYEVLYNHFGTFDNEIFQAINDNTVLLAEDSKLHPTSRIMFEEGIEGILITKTNDQNLPAIYVITGVISNVDQREKLMDLGDSINEEIDKNNEKGTVEIKGNPLVRKKIQTKQIKKDLAPKLRKLQVERFLIKNKITCEL